MASKNCPTLRNITMEDVCEETFAGMGATAYIFLKNDLVGKLKGPDTETTGPTKVYKLAAADFKKGKGLYKVELKPESQNVKGSLQKQGGGFKQTFTLVIDAVNEEVNELLRALSNLDWGIIIPDGDKYQIVYSRKGDKIKIDADGLATDTGTASTDDRQTTITGYLANCYYANTWVEITGDIEALVGEAGPEAS